MFKVVCGGDVLILIDILLLLNESIVVLLICMEDVVRLSVVIFVFGM